MSYGNKYSLYPPGHTLIGIFILTTYECRLIFSDRFYFLKIGLLLPIALDFIVTCHRENQWSERDPGPWCVQGWGRGRKHHQA